MADGRVYDVVRLWVVAGAVLAIAACVSSPTTSTTKADEPVQRAEIPEHCAYDLGAMMNLSYEAFEQDMDGGWRPLGSIDGCELVTADLLRTYRVERTEMQRRSLMHHEAQLRAAAGQSEAAIRLLEQLLPLESRPEMMAYREAEIAFLSNDMRALKAAREKLAAIPPPEGFANSVARFKETFPDAPPPVWPLNLDVVDGFIACFGQPYAEAYKDTCRPKAESQ